MIRYEQVDERGTLKMTLRILVWETDWVAEVAFSEIKNTERRAGLRGLAGYLCKKEQLHTSRQLKGS